jgi:hypothetical protein
MMNWSELVITADELIKEFGQPMTIKRVTQGEYDPATSLVTNVTTNIGTTGVIFDFGESDINGTTILKGDKKVYVTANGVTSIMTNDSIMIGTQEYHITDVTQTSPAGVNLLWELKVRGLS